MDKEFLTSLTQVTAWRWEGVLLVLDGPAGPGAGVRRRIKVD